MKKPLILFALIIEFAFSAIAQPGSESTVPYSHVYYLFIEHPKGCEECYIPMAITRASVDDTTLAAGITDAAVIITYERDSIWEKKQNYQKLDQVADVSERKARKLRWNGKIYRYQEVNRSEAIRLLTHPMGTIPISRPGFLAAPAEVQKHCALMLANGVKDPACDASPGGDLFAQVLKDLSSIPAAR